MTLANKISLLRIALTPFFLIFLLYQAYLPAFIFFVLSALTDAFDGLIARKRREQTRIGSFIDPLADKVFLIPTYIMLTAHGHLPKWFFVLLLSRDFTILLGWLIYIHGAEEAFKMAVRKSGKISIAIQMAFFGLMLFGLSFEGLSDSFYFMLMIKVSLFITAISTFISFLDYLILGTKSLGRILD